MSFETKEMEFMRENTRKWKKRVSVLQTKEAKNCLWAAEGLICFISLNGTEVSWSEYKCSSPTCAATVNILQRPSRWVSMSFEEIFHNESVYLAFWMSHPVIYFWAWICRIYPCGMVVERWFNQVEGSGMLGTYDT